MESNKCDKFTQCDISSVSGKLKCDVTTQCVPNNVSSSAQCEYVTLATDEFSGLNPGQVLSSMLPPLQKSVNALFPLSQESLYVCESQNSSESVSICECCHRVFDSSELTSIISNNAVSSSPGSSINRNNMINERVTVPINRITNKSLNISSENISSDESMFKMTVRGETCENRATKRPNPESTETGGGKIVPFSKEQCIDGIHSERNSYNQCSKTVMFGRKSKNAHEMLLKRKSHLLLGDTSEVPSNATQVPTADNVMLFNSMACERASSPEDLCEELCRELSKAKPNSSKYMKKVHYTGTYNEGSESVVSDKQKFFQSPIKTAPRKLNERKYESKSRKRNLVSIHSNCSRHSTVSPMSKSSCKCLKRKNISSKTVSSRHFECESDSELDSDSSLEKRYESKRRNADFECNCASHTDNTVRHEGRRYDRRSRMESLLSKKVNWKDSTLEISSDDDCILEKKKSNVINTKTTSHGKERDEGTAALSNTTQGLKTGNYLYFNSLACERASSPEDLCEETCQELSKTVPNSFKLMEKMLNVDTRHIGSKRKSNNALKEKKTYFKSPSKTTSSKLNELSIECVNISDSDREESALSEGKIFPKKSKRRLTLSKKGNRSGRMSENSLDSECNLGRRRKNKILNKTIELTSAESKKRRHELTKNKMLVSSRPRSLVSYTSSDSSSENEAHTSSQRQEINHRVLKHHKK